MAVEDGLFYTYQNVLTADETLAPFVSVLAKQTKGIGFEVAEDKDFEPDSRGREKYNLKHTLDDKKAGLYFCSAKLCVGGKLCVSGKLTIALLPKA